MDQQPSIPNPLCEVGRTHPRDKHRMKPVEGFTGVWECTKHGIYATDFLLPGESQADYDALLSAFWGEFAPAGCTERVLVQRLADTQWRMNRLDRLECGFFAHFAASRQDSGDTAHRNVSDSLVFLDGVERGMLAELSDQRMCAERLFRRSLQDLQAMQSARKDQSGPPPRHWLLSLLPK